MPDDDPPPATPPTDGPARWPRLPAPPWLVRAATVAGLLAVVGGAAWLLGQLVSALTTLLVALAVAALVAGTFAPLVNRADRRGLPRWVSSLAVVVLLLAVVGGLGALLGASLAEQAPQLADRVQQATQRLPEPLRAAVPEQVQPSGASDGSQSSGGSRPPEGSQSSGGALGQAASAVSGAFEVLVGVFLALAFAFLFLKDGRSMWRWTLRRVAPGPRARVARAGTAAWHTVGAYVRGLTVVAVFDAVGIGLGLLALGVPLVLLLAVLQFALSYVPTIGALVGGALAVAVALVDGGVTTALLTLVLVVVVQQVGNDVIEPWVMGRSLRLHPAVVLVAVTAGGLLWGIAGALLFVPLTAAVAAAVREVYAETRSADDGGTGTAPAR
ncbi:AI-2E family transporter [Aquipuribacter sp. SD81]|uniref:AI-2E family transporter n=1 Tax=Aquipuribacter sp. SD81 TaxID=3127703 RepID=UPI003019C758